MCFGVDPSKMLGVLKEAQNVLACVVCGVNPEEDVVTSAATNVTEIIDFFEKNLFDPDDEIAAIKSYARILQHHMATMVRLWENIVEADDEHMLGEC